MSNENKPDARAESDMREAFAQDMGQPWEAALEAARRIWSLAWGASRFYAHQAQPDERAAFEDPDVQTVYNALCENDAPPLGEHWEGWVARRIVHLLRATQQATTGDERADALQDMAFVNGVQTGYKFGLVEDHAAYEKCIASRDGYLKVLRETRATTPSPVTGSAGQAPKLAVWYGSMPESNGKSNWTAILHNGDIASGMTIARSEYPDRVRYEADRLRWLIGDLENEPFILDYDADKHSGYKAPTAPSLTQGSAGQAPIYQLQQVNGAWRDVSQDEYENLGKNWRRIVYTAPSLATDAGAVRDDLREAITDAARSLSIRADELKESNTSVDGTWCDAEEQAQYEAEVRLIERLRALLAAQPTEQRMSDAAPFVDDAERAMFLQTMDEFDDCNETATDDRLLMKWAIAGLLECNSYLVTEAGQTVRDAARKGANK